MSRYTFSLSESVAIAGHLDLNQFGDGENEDDGVKNNAEMIKFI